MEKSDFEFVPAHLERNERILYDLFGQMQV